jgi:hypothetical protein
LMSQYIPLDPQGHSFTQQEATCTNFCRQLIIKVLSTIGYMGSQPPITETTIMVPPIKHLQEACTTNLRGLSASRQLI